MAGRIGGPGRPAPFIPARAIFLRVFGWLAAGVLSAWLALPAEAAKLRFGDDETLHVVAPTQLGTAGKPISLCYKASTYFFVAGVYTTDEYVLCEGGTSTRYWPMPAAAPLAALQGQGMIPAPLPPYKRDVLDYVVGYSLWLVIAFVVAASYFSRSSSAAQAARNVGLLKSAVRRVMARTLANAHGGPEKGAAAAGEVYRRLFNEPLENADFVADMAWVRDQPAAYDGFIGAMGRKFDNGTKGILLRTAAHVALADGPLDAGEEEAIRHLAQKLGVKAKEADNFLAVLHQQSQAGAAPQTAAAPQT
ncbi:MAG: TerB family tellurite resistance protein [Hyphomicrobium sp.]